MCVAAARYRLCHRPSPGPAPRGAPPLPVGGPRGERRKASWVTCRVAPGDGRRCAGGPASCRRRESCDRTRDRSPLSAPPPPSPLPASVSRALYLCRESTSPARSDSVAAHNKMCTQRFLVSGGSIDKHLGKNVSKVEFTELIMSCIQPASRFYFSFFFQNSTSVFKCCDKLFGL